MRDQNSAATAVPVVNLPERMAETADEWIQEANDKEAEANELRRRELSLRNDIHGLRVAAHGMRRALVERMELAEKHSSVIQHEQDGVEEAVPEGRMSSSYQH